MDEKLILGKAIADSRLEGVELWPYPDVTTNREAILNNAYNHTFTLKEPEELESDQLALPTLEEIDRIRHDAYQEGIAQGRQAGFDQGLEEGKPEGFDRGKQEGQAIGEQEGIQIGLNRAQTMVENFHGLMTQLMSPLSRLEDDIEKQMLSLITCLAEGVLLESIRVHPEHIITLIRHGIEALPFQHQAIILNLHPDDRTLVQDFFGEEQFSDQHWNIEIDTHLQRGELRIETQHAEVDLTLATRLQAIFQAVLHQQQVPAEPYVETNEQPPEVSYAPTATELDGVASATQPDTHADVKTRDMASEHPNIKDPDDNSNHEQEPNHAQAESDDSAPFNSTPPTTDTEIDIPSASPLDEHDV